METKTSFAIGLALVLRTSRKLALALALSTFGTAWVASDAAAQSYPKLLTNGHGLAVTRLAIFQRMAGNWHPAPSYQPGQQYRAIIRVTNFYPPINPGGYDRCHVVRITDLRLELILPARFYASSSFSGSGMGSRWTRDDSTPLLNGQSRSYTAYFVWNGPPIPTPLAQHKIGLTGGEVCVLPNGSGIVRVTG